MLVVSKSSFYMLVTCLTFFVNKQVQAIMDDLIECKVKEYSKAKALRYCHSGVGNQDECEEFDNDTCINDLIDVKTFFYSFLQPQPPIYSPSIIEIEVEQKLDHFNDMDKRTWKQRAYFDDRFETDDGPVLLRIGQLKPIFPYKLEDPTMVYLGRSLNAALYVLEHRFYGKSVPTNLSTDNLIRYSNTEQVLADINNFIQKSIRVNKKWILLGNGYGGTLAAWFRLKYPCVASSALIFGAPLLAMTEEEETYNVFKNYPGNVKVILQDAFDKIRDAITQSNYKDLQEKFNMCTSLEKGNKDDNVKFMYGTILDHLADVIEKNSDTMMMMLTDESVTNPLDRLANVIKRINGNTCFFVDFDDAINKYKNVNILYENQIDYPLSLKEGLGIRPHFFQRCMEYGFFESTGDGSHSFGIRMNVDFYCYLCQRVFDIPEFDLDYYKMLIDNTNKKYGGQNIQTTNLIAITPNDPFWKSIEMVESPHTNNVLITIDYEVENKTYMMCQFELIIELLSTWTEDTCTEDKDGEEVANGTS